MDFHSLVAAHLPAPNRPDPADARAEARYWREQLRSPVSRAGLPAPLATIAGALLLLLGSAKA